VTRRPNSILLSQKERRAPARIAVYPKAARGMRTRIGVEGSRPAARSGRWLADGGRQCGRIAGRGDGGGPVRRHTPAADRLRPHIAGRRRVAAHLPHRVPASAPTAAPPHAGSCPPGTRTAGPSRRPPRRTSPRGLSRTSKEVDRSQWPDFAPPASPPWRRSTGPICRRRSHMPGGAIFSGRIPSPERSAGRHSGWMRREAAATRSVAQGALPAVFYCASSKLYTGSTVVGHFRGRPRRLPARENP
jgi:hypothetical protein